jgi:S1-C subfamily serine protease
LTPGSFVFTTNGEFGGLVIDDAGERAIVGADVLQIEIDRVRNLAPGVAGHLGVEVQPLSPAIAAVTGATGGVVVTWVDAQGPAAGTIAAGDVIEEANGERVTAEQWRVRTARLEAGATVTLRVRRGGEMRELALVAAARDALEATGLGLVMRALPAVGSEVVHVGPSSAGRRAGIEAGDVITLAGEVQAPTPADVRRAYSSSADGRGVLLALTRGPTNQVVALQR